MTGRSAGDGYIPARKRELAAVISAENGAAPGLTDVFTVLGAVFHYEAHDELETLKALYDPIDPDTPDGRRDPTSRAFEAFEKAFAEALERANFTEIEPHDVQTLETTKALTGLAIKPSQAGIRRIRFFARGAEPETIEVRSWLGMRRQKFDVEMLDDVVVLVGFKSAEEISGRDRSAFARMRKGVRPGAALIKHFRNVAVPELVTLHPGARLSMRPRDQVFLAAPALVGGVPVLLNLWPALTVIFAVLAAYIGMGRAIADDELRHALTAASGLFAVGAFVMRQRMKFETQSLRYQKRLADTVYFRNLANNAGVIDLLIGAGEEQDSKEAFLAYWVLLKAGHPMGKGELDMAAEQFLHDRLKLEVDFEIEDALAKLERLGLVVSENDAYRAVPVDAALSKLDAAWDAYFKFGQR